MTCFVLYVNLVERFYVFNGQIFHPLHTHTHIHNIWEVKLGLKNVGQQSFFLYFPIFGCFIVVALLSCSGTISEVMCVACVASLMNWENASTYEQRLRTFPWHCHQVFSRLQFMPQAKSKFSFCTADRSSRAPHQFCVQSVSEIKLNAPNTKSLSSSHCIIHISNVKLKRIAINLRISFMLRVYISIMLSLLLSFPKKMRSQFFGARLHSRFFSFY